ncbi:MAG TPA: hypothetical protein PLP01_12775 [Phycisphaerae bacterium]|nr:hypothetical protein [Phycisphaerae bacterium]
MQWLISLIVAVLRVLLPWAVQQSRPTAQDADPDRQTRDKLRAKAREHFGTSKPKGGDGWGKP